MSDAKGYPPLGVAVDVVLFTVADTGLQVLLTRRGGAPFDGCWSLPGGFVQPTESADEAAERELLAKAGVRDVFLEQLYTFSAPTRDPRSRVISVAYYALAPSERLGVQKGKREASWFSVSLAEGKLAVDCPGGLDNLAFDHHDILVTAIERIRGKLEYVPIGFQLLPPKFTLTELQRVYEAVLGEDVDKRNFRKQMAKAGLLEPLDEYQKGAHRPARYYAFTKRTF